MTQKPNIVMFIVDQLIPMMTSVYGHPCACTPNLDRFAETATVFNAAYSTVPVCVPARVSLLTGMYAKSTGCFDNGGILSPGWPTHNHYLNIAGYDTALAGKAHFVGPEQMHGFQERFTTNIYPSAFKFLPPRGEHTVTGELHPNPIAVDYLARNCGVRQYSMQMNFDEEALLHGRTYLARKRSQMSGSGQEAPPPRDDTPFFLQLGLNHPHEPFHVTQRHWDLYADADIPTPSIPDNIEELRTALDRSTIRLHGSDKVDVSDPENLEYLHRAYLAAVSYVDEKFGEFLSWLEEFGLRDNTIVLFVSDHGDMLGHRGMVQKRVFYEYTARVPLLIHIPAALREPLLGTSSVPERIAEPVSLTDIAPTILECAGISDYRPMDGSSMLPLLRGEHEDGRHVFCENYSEGVDRVCLMVRQGPYKYTWFAGQDEAQLFNVVEDPEELSNLAGEPSMRSVEADLEKLILDRFDPDDIERRAQASVERRAIVQKSILATGGSRWDYEPRQNVREMYWRD